MQTRYQVVGGLVNIEPHRRIRYRKSARDRGYNPWRLAIEGPDRDRQRHRPDVPAASEKACACRGMVQIEFSVGKLVAQTHDDRAFAVDCCAICLPGTIFRSSSLSHRLFCRIEIARCGVERRLRHDVFLE